MSIATAIQNIRSKIAAAYTSCDNKGATMPAADSRDLTNLANTIGTIETPIPVNQTIQKVIATEVSLTQILSTLDNSNTTSSDLTSEGVAQNATNTYLTLQVSGASEYGVSITAKNYTPQSYGAITYFVDKYVNGSWNGVSSDVSSLTVNSNGTGTCSNSSISASGLRIGAYYNNSRYRGFSVSYSDFLAGVDFEIVAKDVTYTDVYTREFENVGTMTSINNNRYKNDTSLVSILIPTTVTSIGANAFDGCSKLKYINLHSVTSLGTTCFYGTGLYGVDIPSGLSHIQSSCFSRSSIHSLYGQENITQIDAAAFQYCSNLHSDINMPNLTTLATNTLSRIFHGCSSIKKVISLGRVTVIPDQMFYECSSLEEVTIPTTVTQIRDQVFYQLKKLTSVTGFDNVTYLGNAVFSGCSNLKMDISFPSLTSTYSNSQFKGSGITKILSLGSLTSIPYQMCYDCQSLTEVNLPLTCTNIGQEAFYQDRALTTVTGFDNVEVIGMNAFKYTALSGNLSLPSLTSFQNNSAFAETSITKILTLGDITTIPTQTFYYCTSLTEVTLPSTLTSISQEVFQSCFALTTVTVNATTPPSLGSNVFKNCNSLAHIYVPSTSVADYQAATGWIQYASIIQAIP